MRKNHSKITAGGEDAMVELYLLEQLVAVKDVGLSPELRKNCI